MQGYRTYLSILVSLVATLANDLGYQIDTECLTNTTIALGGMISALWFRFQSTRNPK